MSFPYNQTNQNSHHYAVSQSQAKLVNGGQQQQQQQQSTPPLQRRESLVKPTWHNVCPGQVPHDTLEKLNKLSSNEQRQYQQLNQYDVALSGSGAGTSSSFDGNSLVNIGSNSNNQIVSKVVGKQRRQVELYDIFGKVKL